MNYIFESCFFKHGRVCVCLFDPEKRKASFDVYAPVFLVQTITPSILEHGVISNYEIMSPLASWVPVLGRDRFKEGIDEDSTILLNEKIQEDVNSTLESFVALSKVLDNVNDVVPILPLGVYVKFRYGFQVDTFPYLLINLEKSMTIGVPEIKYALAECYAFTLNKLN